MAKYLVPMLLGSLSAQSVNASYTSSGSSFKWNDIKHVIAFGDSYTYVQGTLGYPKYSFIGDYEDNFSFTPEELLSDQIIQNFNGTSAGGPNWVEFLSGCGLDEGLTTPSTCNLPLWDFAFAGANIAEAFTPLHHPFTVPLVNQTQQYLTWADPVLKGGLKRSKALVAIWIGINDIIDTSTYSGDLPGLYDSMIQFMFNNPVESLYQAGFRNFLFMNLPPLHRSPYNLYATSPNLNATMMHWWNERLSQHNAKFSHSHKSSTSMVYDTYSFLNNVLDNPATYGVANTTHFCPGYIDERVLVDPEAFGCTPIDGYFWFNSAHITSHIHKLLAQDLVHFLKAN